MGTIKKVILFIIGLIFTMAFIAEGSGYFNKSMALSKTTKGSYDSSVERIANSQYGEFDGTTVSGADAISAIRLHAADNFTVTVKTNRTSTVYNKPQYSVSDITANNYIEPTKKFNAKLETNDNGSVSGITLTQIK